MSLATRIAIITVSVLMLFTSSVTTVVLFYAARAVLSAVSPPYWLSCVLLRPKQLIGTRHRLPPLRRAQTCALARVYDGRSW